MKFILDNNWITAWPCWWGPWVWRWWRWPRRPSDRSPGTPRPRWRSMAPATRPQSGDTRTCICSLQTFSTYSHIKLHLSPLPPHSPPPTKKQLANLHKSFAWNWSFKRKIYICRYQKPTLGFSVAKATTLFQSVHLSVAKIPNLFRINFSLPSSFILQP